MGIIPPDKLSGSLVRVVKFNKTEIQVELKVSGTFFGSSSGAQGYLRTQICDLQA
jgi:hypothetical protein